MLNYRDDKQNIKIMSIYHILDYVYLSKKLIKDESDIIFHK